MQASSNQLQLANRLVREGVIQHPEVIQVLSQVDRANYIDVDPYYDSPQGIACGQTISAPHMHGFALSMLLPSLLKNSQSKDTLKMLDVGCGSGYFTAALGRWIQPLEGEDRILPKPGQVYGMDIHAPLVKLARSNMEKADGDLLTNGSVQLKQGNGWKGWPEKGPFDVIHVGAAADAFPVALANQLALGGTLIVPIGHQWQTQYLYKVVRVAETGDVEKDFEMTKQLGVRYVPLIHDNIHDNRE